jgi:hypothetical protein
MLQLLLIIPAIAAVAFIAARVYGQVRWAAGTQTLRAGLDAARTPVGSRTVDFDELAGLPAPVQRFFRSVLSEGQPVITSVHLRHRGTFNMSETAEQWKAFTSDQQVVIRRPGFDWDGRIQMFPGAAVHVHDAYVAGEGVLHASLLGAITLANLRGGGEIAEGELMRFLAEAAWYPTALLPSHGVRWSALDDRSASATLVDGARSVTLRFTFLPDGPIETVDATARARMVGGNLEHAPWHGRFWNYEARDGFRVPMDGEVSWLLPDGPKPYWRGHTAEIAFTVAP